MTGVPPAEFDGAAEDGTPGESGGPAGFDAPLLDHSTLDLAAARQITYRIEQCFRYSYDEPVTALSQRLVAVPRQRHGDSYRRAHAVTVTGTSARRRTSQDETGNTVVRVTAPYVAESVEFRIDAVVERVRDDHGHRLDAAALGDPRLLTPTWLTAPDDDLRTLAATVIRPGGGPLDIAERACHAAHEAIRYEYGVTGVYTTAAQALAGGRGVCQDSAHVMVALCHVAGLPVRYVSGHLLGQGGTHAWVEVIVPDRDAALAVAFDPCHGRRTDGRYVTVAVGRDYADVAPTSGTFVGPPGGRLTTTRQVGVVAIDT